MNFENLIGTKNNELTVVGIELRPYRNTGKQRNVLKCQCTCGNTTYVLPYQFISGDIKSCGCLRHRVPYNATHKLSKTPLYHIWETMRLRCGSPNNKKYYMYGARGITVCEEWVNDFLAFQKWSLDNGYAKGLTLDRRDNNMGYSPANCRWVSRKCQQRNTRRNIYITYKGKTQTLIEWCEELSLNYKTVNNRIARGWDSIQALTTPIATRS